MSKKQNELAFDKIHHRVRGLPFSIFFPKQNIEDAFDYRPHDGDIVITSYPKSGSTWMQYIVMQILSMGERFPSMEETTLKLCPIMELAGRDAVEAIPEPRIFKHHIPYNRIPKNPKAKTISIYRHPEDVLVSYFHFISGLHPDVEIPFDTFFEAFLAGGLGYGSYFLFMKTLLSNVSDHNILLVSYEKVKSNPKEEILRIARFLDPKRETQLRDEPEALGKVLLHTSFDYMKKNLNIGNPLHKDRKVTIFRKGKVGDGKNLMSRQQLDRLKAHAHEVMEGNPVLEEWYVKKPNIHQEDVLESGR